MINLKLIKKGIFAFDKIFLNSYFRKIYNLIKYKNHKIKFANGGDRDSKNTLEIKFCKDNKIETLWGVGGNHKSNSSSWILKKWKDNN